MPKPEGAGHAHDHGDNQGGMDHGAMATSAVLPAKTHDHDAMPAAEPNHHDHDK